MLVTFTKKVAYTCVVLVTFSHHYQMESSENKHVHSITLTEHYIYRKPEAMNLKNIVEVYWKIERTKKYNLKEIPFPMVIV